MRVPIDSNRESNNQSFRFRIEEDDAGLRVDEFLASRFGALSRMRITNLIESGACVVNGTAARAGLRVLADDSLEISFAEGAPTGMLPEPMPLEVIYEDESLAVVVKPSGMLVHPTLSVKSGTLINALAYHFNREIYENSSSEARGGAAHGERHALARPGLVHRLDRETSGLMVVAKTPRPLTILSKHFRKRLVEKRYTALVFGEVEQPKGTINAPIGRDPERRPRWRVMDDGKEAETRYSMVERLNGATLLELTPVTGRTNQLRIHCAYIGHPIVGDMMHSQHEGADRLCLHASRLAFHHPDTGDWKEFTSPLPDDFQAIVGEWRKA